MTCHDAVFTRYSVIDAIAARVALVILVAQLPALNELTPPVGVRRTDCLVCI